jgi:hypothetical protein
MQPAYVCLITRPSLQNLQQVRDHAHGMKLWSGDRSTVLTLLLLVAVAGTHSCLPGSMTPEFSVSLGGLIRTSSPAMT